MNARRSDDVTEWADGWCPVRLASEELAWRPVTWEHRGLRTWRRDVAGGAWVADEHLPRGSHPWEHCHGALDVVRGLDVFELPAKGDDVPRLDARPACPPPSIPRAVAVEAGPVEGEDEHDGDGDPLDALAGEQLGAELPQGDAAPSPEYFADASTPGPGDASRGAPDDAAAVEAPAAPREPFVPWQSAPFPPTLTSSRASRYGRSSAPRAPLPDDAAAVRAALTDPEGLAGALGLCEGAQGWGKGATWTRQPGGVLVRCPAHGDRTPSCSVTRGGDGTVRVMCFGCELAGDALDLVAAVYGLDRRAQFVRVLEHAAHLAGVRLSTPGDRAPVAPPPRRAPPPPPSAPSSSALPLDVAAELARALLAAAPLDASGAADVRAYLDARGILAGALRDGWGALPSSEVGRADVRARIIAAVGVDAWERSGLAHPHDGDRFAWGSTHRLVIPWRDFDGAPTWLQRRAVARVEGPRYVAPSGTSPVAPYGAHQLAALPLDGPVAVVEGAVDALALRAACERDGAAVAVLALPGVKGWRRAWGAMLAGRVVALAHDGDDSGDAAAEELGAELAGVAATVQRWRPVEGKDWSEAWQRTQATARAS